MGGGLFNPIPHSEIVAWNALQRRRFTQFELRLLDDLESIALDSLNKRGDSADAGADAVKFRSIGGDAEAIIKYWTDRGATVVRADSD